MRFEKIHEDARGEIYLVLDALREGRELTILTTNMGYARGGCVHKENGETCVVIKGKIRYWIGDSEPVTLGVGDTCYIKSDTPHYFVALTDGTIVIEWGATPDEKKEKHQPTRAKVDKINEEQKKNEEKYVKRWSKTFGREKDWARTTDQRNHPDRLILQKLVKPPVIDVGCGSGLDAEYYDDYVGIDVTPEFIDAAYNIYGVKKLVLCDARYLPFKDKSFETAFSKGVLIHYPQKEGEKMLHEMIRISNITYIAWGIPLLGHGHGKNYIPTGKPCLSISKSGFHVNKYDLNELEKQFEVHPQKNGTSVTLVKKRTQETQK